LSALDPAACDQHLAWLLGGREPPGEVTGLVWALGHFDDGVTWGRRAQDRVWRLGQQVAPDVSPPVRPQTLQELRLFGHTAEVFIWRTDEGLRGRVLRENDSAVDHNDETNPLRPSDESRIIRGTRIIAQCEQSFTHIGDGAGAEQILPRAVTNEQLQGAQVVLTVRHYWEQDRQTGAVRIAVTRLVELAVGGSDVD
jgi:CRISPR-associated protein (TIGR03984 family)